MQARDDLNEIYAYLESSSRKVAIEVTQTIAQKTRLLSTFPEMGRVVPVAEDETLRERMFLLFRKFLTVPVIPKTCKRGPLPRFFTFQNL